MACSKFEYVKKFEQHASLLPNTWIVIRLDGKGFHRFSKMHQFEKPNDTRALHLMNLCAENVMKELDDIVCAYGQSDEFSFVLKKDSMLWGRREAKLITNFSSLFTSNYVMHWKKFFDIELMYPPSFDARAVCYPNLKNLRDYLSWRQADCHINNLYNTAFWALVLDKNSPKSEREAQCILKDTDASLKNELLFTQFGINYAKLPEIFRKGSFVYQHKCKTREKNSKGQEIERQRRQISTIHQDIIGDALWDKSPFKELLL